MKSTLAEGHNRAVIRACLTENGSPMQAIDIARTAHQKGLISSNRGQLGVYNIIQTVLRRNKNTFVLVARGRWGLRERDENLCVYVRPPARKL